MKSSAKPSAAQPSATPKTARLCVVAVREHQVRDRDREEDDQPAHRRRPRLRVVLLRALLADLLAELAHPQELDELRPEEDRDQHRRHPGDQHLAAIDRLSDEQVAHELARRQRRRSVTPRAPSRATSVSVNASIPTEREPLTRIASPLREQLPDHRDRRLRVRRPVVGRIVARQLADADDSVDARASGRGRRPHGGTAAACGPSSAIPPSTAILRPGASSEARWSSAARIETGLAL